jgi:signal transduction histidine kinase
MMIGRSDRLRELGVRWSKLPLAHKFAIAGIAVTFASMILCGILTTTVMTEIVLARRGAVVSAIAQRVLSPTVQHLNGATVLDASARLELDTIMEDPIFSAEFPYLDLWLPGGEILYSNAPKPASDALKPPREVLRAFGGSISVQFTDVDSPHYSERGFATDYIEVYFPLFDSDTGDVVAVAQLREITASLERDLAAITLASWVTAAVITAVVVATLFGVVLEGSRKIERQGRILSKRLAQSHARAAHHRQLKSEAQRASRMVTELTDQHLRTIGTDIHDGPAQSIAFAVLKLDEIRHLARAAERNKVVSDIEATLGGALSEIRAIATALVLPDIENLDLAEVIDRAIKQHIRRTNSVIAVDSMVEPVHVAPEIAVCVFRFIQEGLNNAFHHGLPEGQKLTAVMQSGVLKLSVTNNYIEQDRSGSTDHLGIGLYGLRARVQSIGGNFTFVQGNGQTRVEMWLRHA